MNIAELFIRRPVMTTLVMLGILLFGIMGYRALPISDLPNVRVGVTRSTRTPTRRSNLSTRATADRAMRSASARWAKPQ